MSSILSNKKLTIRQLLARDGWERSKQWGAPFSWSRSTIHWIKIIEVEVWERTHTVAVMYFPDKFDAYVTKFAKENIVPAKHLFFMDNDNSTFGDWISPEVSSYEDIHIYAQEYGRWLAARYGVKRFKVKGL